MAGPPDSRSFPESPLLARGGDSGWIEACDLYEQEFLALRPVLEEPRVVRSEPERLLYAARRVTSALLGGVGACSHVVGAGAHVRAVRAALGNEHSNQFVPFGEVFVTGDELLWKSLAHIVFAHSYRSEYSTVDILDIAELYLKTWWERDSEKDGAS